MDITVSFAQRSFTSKYSCESLVFVHLCVWVDASVCISVSTCVCVCECFFVRGRVCVCERGRICVCPFSCVGVGPFTLVCSAACGFVDIKRMDALPYLAMLFK